MLIGLLTTILVFDGLFLALMILIQKSKGGMGLGALGGGAQTLFGGSGGQDLFQKITWLLGGIFIALSLGLAILRARSTKFDSYALPLGATLPGGRGRRSVPEPRPGDVPSNVPTPGSPVEGGRS